MKFHNKNPKYREQWVEAPAPKRYLWDEAKVWCQNHQSNNRFYFQIGQDKWLFENKDDALHFALVWV